MISIIGVGDIMPGGILTGLQKGWVDDDILQLLQEADIRVGTLECAIGNTPNFNPEKMKRKADVIYAPEFDIDKLTTLGINIVSLANNHFCDLGHEAAKNTISLLEQKGIAHIGAGENLEEAKAPVVKVIKGKRVAFVAYCDWREETVGWCPFATASQYGVNPMYDEYVINDIKQLKQHNDYVVVMPHWGIEHTWTTTNHVYDMAKKMIKAGADFIIGSHPHRIQPVVCYRNRIVAFSLGNFLFPDRLICKPRSTYYSPIELDLGSLPRTDGYPYVEEITYKAWKPLAYIGMIIKINIDAKTWCETYLTKLTEAKLQLFQSKEISNLLSKRNVLLKYTPYSFFYVLFYKLPRIFMNIISSVMHKIKKAITSLINSTNKH